jgi:hypothetical protein
LEKQLVTPEELGGKVRELDAELMKEDDDRLRTRFAELFETS